MAVFVSCEKDCVKPTGINGEWIWQKSVSTWGTWTPENTGEHRKLKIDDFIYREYINDSLVYESQYDLEIREDSVLGPRNFIVFSSGSDLLIGIGESKLLLTEYNWDDGFTYYYNRK